MLTHRLALDGDVVVVTLNYWLGIFGAFGYPGLDGSGTFGLADQQAALRWVQRNIAAFGGDPGNVTLFGESYGALSTTAQLTSPGAQGVTSAMVDAIAATTVGLSKLGGVKGGHEDNLRLVHHHLISVARLLRQARFANTAVANRLLAEWGRLSRLAGWLAHEVRHEALLCPDGGERPSISLSS